MMGYFVYYLESIDVFGFETFATEAEAVAFINERVAQRAGRPRKTWRPDDYALVEGRTLDLELVGDTDTVQVKRSKGERFMPVAAEDIAIGCLIMLSDDKRSVRRNWPASGKADGMAFDSIAKGERAFYDAETGKLLKIQNIN